MKGGRGGALCKYEGWRIRGMTEKQQEKRRKLKRRKTDGESGNVRWDWCTSFKVDKQNKSKEEEKTLAGIIIYQTEAKWINPQSSVLQTLIFDRSLRCRISSTFPAPWYSVNNLNVKFEFMAGDRDQSLLIRLLFIRSPIKMHLKWCLRHCWCTLCTWKQVHSSVNGPWMTCVQRASVIFDCNVSISIHFYPPHFLRLEPNFLWVHRTEG